MMMAEFGFTIAYKVFVLGRTSMVVVDAGFDLTIDHAIPFDHIIRQSININPYRKVYSTAWWQ